MIRELRPDSTMPFGDYSEPAGGCLGTCAETVGAGQTVLLGHSLPSVFRPMRSDRSVNDSFGAYNPAGND